MNTEIEVKYCKIDIDDIRRRLEKAGGVCEQPMRLMRRVLIEEPHHAAEHSFIRIRDQGDRVTLTFKRREDEFAANLHGTKEVEVTVSDFDATVALFEEAGWKYKTYQESKRETWQLGDAEVVIDEWPWIEPYIEIEASHEKQVREAAEKLGLEWSDALVGHIDMVYAQDYEFAPGIRGVIDFAEVRFGAPLPQEFKKKD